VKCGQRRANASISRVRVTSARHRADHVGFNWRFLRTDENIAPEYRDIEREPAGTRFSLATRVAIGRDAFERRGFIPPRDESLAL